MCDLVSLKITINSDANYLLFGERICRDVKELEAFCKSRFQDLQKNVNEFRYFWIDDDGDEIRITTDEDYRSFLQAMANAKARLYVVEKKTTLAAEPGNQDENVVVQAEADDDAPVQNDATGVVDTSRPLHQHIICDVCDEEIVGHRYKCLSCHDYDLCMSCEAKFRHKDHLMLRVPKPAMMLHSHSLISRMFDKLRLYSTRIASNAEKEAAVPDPEVSGGPGSKGISDANGMKRSRSGHRSKHSEERRGYVELSKPLRSCKMSGGPDRKQNVVAAETTGERSAKETKENPSSQPTVSEMTQRYRDMMVMYLNSTEALDPKGNPVPWSTSDHVTVANVAAATATAAAARAAAVANKVLQANMKATSGKPTSPTEPTPQELVQMLRHAKATMKPPKPASTTTAPATAPRSVTPIPFLPFVNLAWPSQEKLMVASENVSKLLDPLGLSFEIRHKPAGAPSTPPGGSPKTRGDNASAPVPPATSTTVAEAAPSQPTSEKQEEQDNKPLDKKPENDIPTKEEPPQQVATEAVADSSNTAQTPKENAATEKSNSEEKEEPKNPTSGGSLLESDSIGNPDKPEAVAVENEPDDEEDSQHSSSASLLTDDDQDLLEVEEGEGKENSSAPSKPPKVAEKSWTLIDIPNDHDEDKPAAASVPLDAIVKLIGQDLSFITDQKTPAQLDKEKKKDKSAEESKPKEPKKVRKMFTEQRDGSELGSICCAEGLVLGGVVVVVVCCQFVLGRWSFGQGCSQIEFRPKGFYCLQPSPAR
ncbi:protein ref(2)P [Anopheles stephensi]|uniref:protein ref(2)P n=1 Tax=Anopheles stephensi TaxID=30069 RepID=UPI0016589AFC|nr:protein ref(2)P [Anopheles stephensi]